MYVELASIDSNSVLCLSICFYQQKPGQDIRNQLPHPCWKSNGLWWKSTPLEPNRIDPYWPVQTHAGGKAPLGSFIRVLSENIYIFTIATTIGLGEWISWTRHLNFYCICITMDATLSLKQTNPMMTSAQISKFSSARTIFSNSLARLTCCKTDYSVHSLVHYCI